ncbi:MAG: SAM-dependent methyltransferase [Anaeroplasmataceae bacterium]|nr:SAM-dependent methyltransferase [Anaeroplasmataceae bacterium]
MIKMKKDELLAKLKKSYKPEYLANQLAYKMSKECEYNKNDFLTDFLNRTKEDIKIQNELSGYEYTIEDVQNLFEGSIDNQEKKQNGIVYTPKYIVDYIIENTIDLETIEKKIVVDPACGCGAFLTGLISKLSNLSSEKLSAFISNNLFGFDLNPSCKSDVELVIQLQLQLMNKSSNEIKINVITIDSLFENWENYLPAQPNYVIGNPPYVKVQNLKKEYIDKLKSTFVTTKSGGFNLFYAFIEKSMNSLIEKGKLGFITPNNFLKTRSGFNLRKYISSNKYLKTIIDFDCNMIFSPVMTYNCILFMDKAENENIDYAVMERTTDIEKELDLLEFKNISVEALDNDGWLLLSESIREKIKRIQSFENKIDKQIKTGIATLRDKLYIIDKIIDGKYYKIYNEELYEIEHTLLRPLYKVSDIYDSKNIKFNEKYIIFPYDENITKPKPLSESILKERYPLTYKYFEAIKPLLDERSKFKFSVYYEYGRSQGINNTGRKLMYSQFLGKPKFILCEDERALICNGFAIYEDERLDLICLQKILQSSVMDFYIKNTSYSIEGGFHCYQKKYLKGFSYPTLTNEQIQYLKNETDEKKMNKFIYDLYF